MSLIDDMRRKVARLQSQAAAQLTNYDVTVESTDPLVVSLPDGSTLEGCTPVGVPPRAGKAATLQVGGGRSWLMPSVVDGDPAPGETPEAVDAALSNLGLGQDALGEQLLESQATVAQAMADLLVAQATADQASVDAAAAAAAADAAGQTAGEAGLVAGSASAVLSGTSATAPATRRGGQPLQGGDLYYQLDSSTPPRLVGIQIRGVSAWAPYQIAASSVLVPSTVGSILLENGAVTAPKIGAQAVTAEKLAVDALDFKTATGMTLAAGTITGALVQTQAEANRGVKMNSGGLTGHDSFGRQSFRLDATDGETQVNKLHVIGTDAIITHGQIGTDPQSMHIYNKTGPVTEARIVVAPTAVTISTVGSDDVYSSALYTEPGKTTLGTTQLGIEGSSVKAPNLPTTSLEALNPVVSDINGNLSKWLNAPRRPMIYTATVASGTVIASGGYVTCGVTISPGATPRAIIPQLANFPGGSAFLAVRLAAFSATSADVYVINTGAASATLSGALTVRAVVLV